MNRKQRRAVVSKTKTPFEKAGAQIGSALEALQRIKGLEGTANMQEEMSKATALIEALAQDIQTLGHELDVQREVNLRLMVMHDELHPLDLEQIKKSEAVIRTLIEGSGEKG